MNFSHGIYNTGQNFLNILLKKNWNKKKVLIRSSNIF